MTLFKKLSAASFAVIVAALFTLFATSCTTNEQATSEEANSENTKISFVLDYVPNTNHTGVYVAQALGYYAEEGLDVEIIQPPESGTRAMVGSGKAQFGVSEQDGIAGNLASENPVPITAIAAIIQHNTSGIMSRAEDGITSPAKMAHHVYATWDWPVEQETVRTVVEADGGNYEDIEMVPYAVDDDLAGLKANMFDAVWVFEGWACQAAKVQNYDYNYWAFADYSDELDFYTPTIVANNDFLESDPETVKAFLRATAKGYEYAVTHPDEAADLLVESVPELDSALVHESQKFLADKYIADASQWGIFDEDRWAAYFNWLNEKELLEKKLDTTAGFSNDYLPTDTTDAK
ncbi:MAG: ABC transporter substrate-binding protein [Eggerthellaceae bacterium]|nr:ABC transporter substrate-binding protein [Eggerthellaceae bacterium]